MADIVALVFVVAESPWALVALVALLVIDGFFPLVPGETMVVTLAALGATGHGPSPVPVLLVATASTMVGDGVAFLIGRSIHPTRWALMRGRRAQRGSKARAALAWASARIDRNPGVILIGAKFPPFVRVAIALTVGGLFTANPLLGLAASIAFGMLSATVIGGILRLVTHRALRARPGAPSGDQRVS